MSKIEHSPVILLPKYKLSKEELRMESSKALMVWKGMEDPPQDCRPGLGVRSLGGRTGKIQNMEEVN